MTENDNAKPIEDEGIDFIKWISFFWSERLFFLKVEIIFFIIGVIIALVLPKSYVAVATLLPPQQISNSSRMLSQLTNIVGDIPISSSESLVNLYPDIAKSRTVLQDVLITPYKNSTFEQILLKEYKINNSNRDILINKLKKDIIKGSVNNRTNAVTISATTIDPVLSASLANEVLNQMENFFRYRMKTVATSQRMMIEDRLKDVADSLKIAENNLLAFNERNREIDNSPTLKITELRLAREVEINNTLYIELTRQLEVSKINELQYKPVLNILEKAVPPLERSAPARKKIVIMFLIGGFVAAFSYIKLKEFGLKIIEIIK
ncbi:Wzz/FepE/Etk N-terminal domain-containing protein [Candidatus Latescibacterota bacterium]